MLSPLEHALRDHLADYLAGRASLDEFKDWLIGATWEPHESMAPDVSQLVGRVKLVLAEHSGGYLAEDELRHELTTLVGDRYLHPSLGEMPPVR